MNPRVISILPNTPILMAIDIILSNNFNGVPVTDKDGVLVGILTKYDLIVRKSSIFDDTKVGDVMNNDPLFLLDNANLQDAITAFAEHHRVDPIPVVDHNKKVVGIISRFDMVKLFKEYGVNFKSESGSKTVSSPTPTPVSQNLANSNNRPIPPLLIIGGVVAVSIIGLIVYYFFS